jgi:hypothetical protein
MYTVRKQVSLIFLLVITGDPSKPKAWSRYAPDSTAYKKEHEGCKDSEIQDEKKKSEKGKKKQSEIQELIDKVLWLHLDTQDLYFYCHFYTVLKYECDSIFLVFLYAQFLIFIVGSPVVLYSFLHVINTAWFYFLMTVTIIGSSQYLFSWYVF